MSTSNGTVFRVERTKNYTVMSNHHLQNTDLSLKAKGLLSLMLSLPESWDYSINGLIAICKDGESSVRSGVKELEDEGYIRRERERSPAGQLGRVNFIVSEEPMKTSGANKALLPSGENPHVDNPVLGKPPVENQGQSSTYEFSTKQASNNQSFFPEQSSETSSWTERMEEKELEIKQQIEYDVLAERFDVGQINELLELMLEVSLHDGEYLYIGKEKKLAGLVKRRFGMLDFECIESVIDGLSSNTSKILDTKAYLLTCLYNAPATKHNKINSQVNYALAKAQNHSGASYDLVALEKMIAEGSVFD